MPNLGEVNLVGELINDGYSQANLNYCIYYNNDLIGQQLSESEFKDFWTHIELGAGNYGLEGHTKISQTKTVLMDLKFVSDLPNYVDSLPMYNKKPYNAYHQFAVLFDTLDQLVLKKGDHGIFHVNDIFQEYAEHAADQLRQYAESKKYNQVVIEVVVGDYTKIIPRQTLMKYNKFLYDDVQLKNPEISFYNYGMNGSEMLANSESRENARIKLQTLADLSYSGLYFFPIDHHDIFIPKEEKIEFISKGIFYHPVDEYAPVPYHFPEGPTLSKKYGSVYHIYPSYKCS